MNLGEDDLIKPATRSWWSVPALTRGLAAACLFIVASCAGAVAVPLAAAVIAGYYAARKAIGLAAREHERSALPTVSPQANPAAAGQSRTDAVI